MKTSEKLALALEEAHAPAEMIAKARDGYYGDFTSPLATPASQLVMDANAHGLHAIVRRAVDGEFDASQLESEDWAASPEGQATFGERFGGPKEPPEREQTTAAKGIFIESMFGMFSKEGRVKLDLVERRRADDETDEKRISVLLRPDEARREAIALLEAAVAAEIDQAVYRTGLRLGMTAENASHFLMACREARDRAYEDEPPTPS